MLISTVMMDERTSGIWNRAIIAGVEPHHFLLCHLIHGCITMLIQLSMCCTFTYFFFVEVSTFNSVTLTTLIFALCEVFGIATGLLIASVCDSANASLYFNQFNFFTSLLISGVLWPIEGQPDNFKVFSYFSPFTFVAKALKNIAFKNASVGDKDFQMMLLVMLSWIVVVSSFVLILNLKSRK
jgi:ABC-type polysaccharide/polyol phosphate export permease